MKYKLEEFKVDIGETAIENLFLNQYLPICELSQLRVYLYAYKLAKDPNIDVMMTDKELAEVLNLKVSEVSKAWEYWMQEGVVAYENEAGDPTLVFKSMRQMYFGLTEAYVYQEKIKTYQPKNSQEIREMNDAIEHIIGLELTPTEIMKIQEHIDVTGQSPELIVTGFQYCAENMGKKNLNYVLQVLRNWHLDGINTLDDLEEQEKKQEKSKEIARKKRKYYRPSKESEKSVNNSDDEAMKKLLDRLREGQ